MSDSSNLTSPAADALDPASVPQRRLRSGALMPSIDLGTFGSDHVPHAAVVAAVEEAALLGYRHFDCASVYGNEDVIGESLQSIMRTGIKREEIWITSKLWNDMHAEDDVSRTLVSRSQRHRNSNRLPNATATISANIFALGLTMAFGRELIGATLRTAKQRTQTASVTGTESQHWDLNRKLVRN